MRVLPNTPASEAGLRRHDVVIEMKGKAVRTADEAKQVVDESVVGDVLTVKVRDWNTNGLTFPFAGSGISKRGEGVTIWLGSVNTILLWFRPIVRG